MPVWFIKCFILVNMVDAPGFKSSTRLLGTTTDSNYKTIVVQISSDNHWTD